MGFGTEIEIGIRDGGQGRVTGSKSGLRTKVGVGVGFWDGGQGRFTGSKFGFEMEVGVEFQNIGWGGFWDEGRGHVSERGLGFGLRSRSGFRMRVGLRF